MTITPIIAPQPLECQRCLNIGIPEPTIAQGEQCMEIDNNGEISFTCADCYERLLEQCE